MSSSMLATVTLGLQMFELRKFRSGSSSITSLVFLVLSLQLLGWLVGLLRGAHPDLVLCHPVLPAECGLARTSLLSLPFAAPSPSCTSLAFVVPGLPCCPRLCVTSRWCSVLVPVLSSG